MFEDRSRFIRRLFENWSRQQILGGWMDEIGFVQLCRMDTEQYGIADRDRR